MTIGIVIAACAPLTLALASMVVARTGHPVSLVWAFAFHILNDLGFSNLLPVGLALYSRAAPKGWEAVLIAVYYLQFAMANYLVGYLAGLLSRPASRRAVLEPVGRNLRPCPRQPFRLHNRLLFLRCGI